MPALGSDRVYVVDVKTDPRKPRLDKVMLMLMLKLILVLILILGMAMWMLVMQIFPHIFANIANMRRCASENIGAWPSLVNTNADAAAKVDTELMLKFMLIRMPVLMLKLVLPLTILLMIIHITHIHISIHRL